MKAHCVALVFPDGTLYMDGLFPAHEVDSVTEQIAHPYRIEVWLVEMVGSRVCETCVKYIESSYREKHVEWPSHDHREK